MNVFLKNINELVVLGGLLVSYSIPSFVYAQAEVDPLHCGPALGIVDEIFSANDDLREAGSELPVANDQYQSAFEEAVRLSSEDAWFSFIEKLPYYGRDDFALSVVQGLPSEELERRYKSLLENHYSMASKAVSLAEHYYTETNEGVLRENLPPELVALLRSAEEKGVPSEYVLYSWQTARKTMAVTKLGEFIASHPEATWDEIEKTGLTSFFPAQQLRQFIFNTQLKAIESEYAQMQWSYGWLAGQRRALVASSSYAEVVKLDKALEGQAFYQQRISQSFFDLAEQYPELSGTQNNFSSSTFFTEAADLAEALYALHAIEFQFGYTSKLKLDVDDYVVNEILDRQAVVNDKRRVYYQKLDKLTAKYSDQIDREQIDKSLRVARFSGAKAYETSVGQAKPNKEVWYETLGLAIPRFLESLAIAGVGYSPYYIGPNFLDFDAAGAQINQIRVWSNKHMPGGSILGSDREFQDTGMWSLASSAMPVTNLSSSVFGGVLGVVPWTIDESSKAMYGIDDQELAYLRKTDPYFKASAVSSDVAQGALGLAIILASGGSSAAGGVARADGLLGRVGAMMRPAPIQVFRSQLAQSWSSIKIAGGLSLTSAVGQELYYNVGASEGVDIDEFDIGNVAENTLKGTAGSLMFMGGISALTRSLASHRYAYEFKKLNGRDITVAELQKIQQAAASTAMLTSKGIDVAEAMSDDFGSTLDAWVEADNWAQVAGASLLTLAFVEDTADASQAIAWAASKGVGQNSVSSVEAASIAMSAYYGDKGVNPSELIQSIQNLSNLHERLVSENVLSKEEIDKALLGVLEAHEVGRGAKGKDGFKAGLGNYTQAQISEKYRILREYGISKEIADWVIRSGFAGVATASVLSSLGEVVTGSDSLVIDDFSSSKATVQSVVKRLSSDNASLNPLRNSVLVKAESTTLANEMLDQIVGQVTAQGKRVVELKLGELLDEVSSAEDASALMTQAMDELQSSGEDTIVLVRGLDSLMGVQGETQAAESVLKILQKTLQGNAKIKLLGSAFSDGKSFYEYADSDIRSRVSHEEVRADSVYSIKKSLQAKVPSIVNDSKLELPEAVVDALLIQARGQSEVISETHLKERLRILVSEFAATSAHSKNRQQEVVSFLKSEHSRVSKTIEILSNQRDALKNDSDSREKLEALREEISRQYEMLSAIRAEQASWDPHSGIISFDPGQRVSLYDLNQIETEGLQFSEGAQLAAKVIRASEKANPSYISPTEFQNQVYQLVRVYERLMADQKAINMEAALASVYAAHRVGENELGRDGGSAQIGNYTNRQLAEKSRLMREASIRHELRRWILDEGIAGEDLARLPGAVEVGQVYGRDGEVMELASILESGQSAILTGKNGVGQEEVVFELERRIVEEQSSFLISGKPQFAYFNVRKEIAENKDSKDIDFGAFVLNLKNEINKKGKDKGSDKFIIVLEDLDLMLGEKNEAQYARFFSQISSVLAENKNVSVVIISSADSSQQILKKLESRDVQIREVKISELDADSLNRNLGHYRSEVEKRYENNFKIVISDEVLSKIVESSKNQGGTLGATRISRAALDAIAAHARIKAFEQANYPPSVATEIQQKRSQIENLSADLGTANAGAKEAILSRLQKLQTELSVLLNKNRVLPNEVNVSVQDVARYFKSLNGKSDNALDQLEIRRRLKENREYLYDRVKGQDHAVEKMIKLGKSLASRMRDLTLPVGSALFLGPSGVGKTYLAKKFATWIWGDDAPVMLVPMQDFKSAESVTTLLGAPKGYVGYEEGGSLMNFALEHPEGGVIILDEVEKAHKDAYDFLLTILNEGVYTDSLGRVVDFSNFVFVITSNAGRDQISAATKAGQDITTEGFVKSLTDVLVQKHGFKPEILGRDMAMIGFQTLGPDVLKEIAELEIKPLVDRAKSGEGINIELGEGVTEFAYNFRYRPEFGARAMKRNIKDLIQSPSEAIIVEILDPALYKDATLSITKTETGLKYEMLSSKGESIEDAEVLELVLTEDRGSEKIYELRIEGQKRPLETLSTKIEDTENLEDGELGDEAANLVPQPKLQAQQENDQEILGVLNASVQMLFDASGQVNPAVKNHLFQALIQLRDTPLDEISRDDFDSYVANLFYLAGQNHLHLHDAEMETLIDQNIEKLRLRSNTMLPVPDLAKSFFQLMSDAESTQNEVVLASIINALDGTFGFGPSIKVFKGDGSPSLRLEQADINKIKMEIDGENSVEAKRKIIQIYTYLWMVGQRKLASTEIQGFLEVLGKNETVTGNGD